ncbi:MAG: cytochrome P450 [Candidatus Heimdallarchaeota archaeon]|nr:cytochrome P450 [Candidatus Heimdallarchaeota archaeon]
MSSKHQEINLMDKINYTQMYPYELYKQQREHGEVVRIKDAWLATSYNAVKDVFSDHRFRAVHPSEMAPQMILGNMNPILKAIIKPPLSYIINKQVQTTLTRDWIIFSNPPDHTRIRKLAQKAFTPKAIKAMRPSITKITKELLDQLEDKPKFDLIDSFAYPLPIAMIAEVLGLSEDNSLEFKHWSKDIINGFTAEAINSDVRKKAKVAIEGTVQILQEEVDFRDSNRGDDVISNLLNAKDEDEETITEQEIISNLILLLIAGHETTVNLIANTTYALLNNPNQFDLLKREPSLVDNTLEESLRYDPPLTLTTRKATEDMEFYGAQLKKDDVVEVSMFAANRDAEMFDNPNSFDINRPNARKHLAFGKGIHFCLGAPLARAEGEIAFSEMIKRFPTMKFDPTKHPERKVNFPFSSFEHFTILK